MEYKYILINYLEMHGYNTLIADDLVKKFEKRMFL